MLAPSMITLVESERRDLTVGYLKGAPGLYGFMVVASGGGGNASKLPFSCKMSVNSKIISCVCECSKNVF